MHYKIKTLGCLLASIIAIGAMPYCALSKNIDNHLNSAHFIKNVGQITDPASVPVTNIDFKLCANGAVLFVSNNMLQYQWYKTKSQTSSQTAKRLDNTLPEKVNTDIYTIQMLLVGVNENAVAIAEEEQPYYENYYVPNCNGKTAHSYNKVIYKNVYPNIDWVLYTNNSGTVKYDFIVHPGGKVSDIKLQYKNITSLTLKDGALHASANVGSITEAKPYTYDARSRKVLPSSFVLKDGILSFDVKDIDSNSTIVIDPVLNWSDYTIPDSALGYSIATDTFGNSYVCGYTWRLTDVATSGAYQANLAGLVDNFICKYNASGVKIWSTYYGGTEIERILAAVCNQAGDVFVTGATNSTTNISGGVNPEKRNFAGAPGANITDIFLAKFNSSGNFIWGTYAGGPASDLATTIACDNGGSVYIGGTTIDTTHDTTGHFYKGYQSQPGPGFFARYNASNGRRVWGSFFNGDVKALTLDNRGNLFIGGNTYIYTGVGYGNTYQPNYIQAAFQNVFVCRFKASAGTMSWGTYYGGEEYNFLLSLTCDSFGSVYAGGYTNSLTGISTPDAFQIKRVGIAYLPPPPTPPPVPPYSGFMAKLDSSGKRSWGTYYSGVVNNMLLTPDHKIFIGGVTSNDSGITTPNAYQLTQSGGFIGKITLDGKRIWGTYDDMPGIAYGGFFGGIDGGNRLFAGAYNGVTSPFTGNSDAFITQFYADTNVYIKFPYVDSILCAGQQLAVKYGVTNLFRPGNVFTVQLSDVSGNFTTPVNIGSLSYDDRFSINCTIPLGTTEGVGYKLRILSSAPADTFYNYNVPVRISHYPHPTAISVQPICANLNLTLLDTTVQPPDAKYTWLSPNAARVAGQNNPNIVTGITLADSGDYILVEDNHTCVGRDTVHVHITVAPPEPTVAGDTSLCLGDTLRLTASSPVAGVKYGWFDPASNYLDSIAYIEVADVSFLNAGKYRVAAVLDGCQSSATYGQVVTVHPLPQPMASSNTPICQDDTLKLFGGDTTTVSYTWSGPKSFISAHKDTFLAKAAVAASGVYTIKTTTIHGCVSTTTTTVTVKPSPLIEAKSNSPICEHDDLDLSVGNGAGNAAYSWTGPGNYAANTQTATRPTVELNHGGIYKVAADLDGCKREDTTTVIINPAPVKPQLSSNSPVTTGDVIKLNIGNAQNNISYSWTGPNGFISQLTDPAINNAISAMSGVYTAIARLGICTAFDTITIIVKDAAGKSKHDNDILVFPNPNNGVFRVTGTSKENNVINLAVFASDGKRIYEGSVQPVNNKIDATINIGAVANGVYRLKMLVDGQTVPVSFTVKQ